MNFYYISITLSKNSRIDLPLLTHAAKIFLIGQAIPFDEFYQHKLI